MWMSFLFSCAIVSYQSILTVNFGQIYPIYLMFSLISGDLEYAFTCEY